jgi:hypothetical protein
MSNLSIRDSKTSMNIDQKRPVETMIINTLEKRENDRKANAWSEEIEQRHALTRVLIKNLFSCSSQEQVDRVIIEADKTTESYAFEWGGGVDFHLRIRNAELQVRDYISKGIDLKKVNPKTRAVVVTSKDTTALADSWGHLADRLIKGFKVVVK